MDEEDEEGEEGVYDDLGFVENGEPVGMTTLQKKIADITNVLNESYEKETAPYVAFQQYQVLVYREKGFDLTDPRSVKLIKNIARATLESPEEKDIKKSLTSTRKELAALIEEQEEQQDDEYLQELIESKQETVTALEEAQKLAGANRIKSKNLVLIICKLCKLILDENKKIKHMIRMESLMDLLSTQTSEALKQDKLKGTAARSKTAKETATTDTLKLRAVETQKKLKRLEARMKLNDEVTKAEDELFKNAQKMKLDKINESKAQQLIRQQNDEIKSQTRAMKNERINENAIKEKLREEQQRELEAKKQMNKSKALENAKLRAEQRTEKLVREKATIIAKQTQAGNTTTAAAGSSSSSPYNTTVLSNAYSSSSSSKIQYLVTTGGTPSISGKKLSELLKELNQIQEYNTLKTTNNCLKVIDSLLKEKSPLFSPS